jgi:hypothetical protein
VELVAITVKETLFEVWENVEKNRDLIVDQLEEVRNTLEWIRIGVAQAQKETPMHAKEGVSVPKIVQFLVQESVNFIIMPTMMFLDEETT